MLPSAKVVAQDDRHLSSKQAEKTRLWWKIKQGQAENSH